jgi:hypothetical protein
MSQQIPQLTAEQFYSRIAERVRIGKPFSMVRLGDGELLIIKYPTHTPEEEARAQVAKWFPAGGIENDEIRDFGTAILTACQKADMLGIPSEYEYMRWPKWNRDMRWPIFMRDYGLLEPVGRELFHFYFVGEWWTSGAFDQMLAGAKRVVLIGSRNVAVEFATRYSHLESVEQWLLPPEDFVWRPYAQVKNAQGAYVGEPHYPQLYVKYLRRIHDARWDGTLFLVGAGGLGKHYCHEVKKMGGMGVDVGALFDGWVGIPTRPYLEEAGRYTL